MYTLRTGHKLQNGLLCILRVYNKVYCNIFLFVRHGIFCCPYLHEKALLGILKIYLHVSEKKKNAHYLPETTSSDFLQKKVYTILLIFLPTTSNSHGKCSTTWKSRQAYQISTGEAKIRFLYILW